MTVTVTVPRNVSTAAAGATVFPYGFKITDASHLLLLVDDVPKTLGTDFTVDGVGLDAGGNVTLLTPLAGGETVVRMRSMPYSRDTDFQNLGDLQAATLNNDQDAPILMIQQIAEQLGRNLQLSPSSADGASAVLPAPEPGKLLGWNDDGSLMINFDPSSPGDLTLRTQLANAGGTGGWGSALVGYGTGTVKDVLDDVSGLGGDSGATKVAFKSALTGAVRLTLQQLLDGGEIHSSWFGPDKTGATSATAALQACINAGVGKKVIIDPGTYAIGGSVGLQLPSNTTIIAYGATFNRATAGTEIMRNNSDGSLGGYLANSNIAIYGGTYDGRHDLFPSVNGTLLAFGHCTSVLVKDATLQNTTGSHYIEFNASQYCVADNCIFSGGAEQALSTMEAIQIDAAISSAVFPWFGPWDNTPCTGITVRDCRFLSCGSGIGTHTDPPSQHTNISILNCTIRDTYYAAIRGQGWSGVIIANNRINGGFHGIFQTPAAAFSCNNVIIADNTIESVGNSSYDPGAGVPGRPIVIGSVSGKIVSIVSITGNTVRNATGAHAQHGIYINGSQKFSVTGNIVDNVNGSGIYADGASFGEIVGNHSTLAGDYSLRVSGSSSEITIGFNRGATAFISGNTKLIYTCNIWATSHTQTSNTGILAPNLVNGTSV